jgi:uncharacterized protein involved in exopolysaccharide biosynthesis
MSDPAGPHTTQHSTLREYLTTIRRRKWVIAQAVVLLPVVAIAFSLHQQTLFRADAEVLLSQQIRRSSNNPIASRKRRPTSRGYLKSHEERSPRPGSPTGRPASF